MTEDRGQKTEDRRQRSEADTLSERAQQTGYITQIFGDRIDTQF